VIDGEASPGVEMQQVQGQDLLRSLVQTQDQELNPFRNAENHPSYENRD